MSITYSESDCSLRYPSRNADAPQCRLWTAGSIIPYYATSSHKRHDFRKNVMGYKTCV
jgi:hypothetical protein